MFRQRFLPCHWRKRYIKAYSMMYTSRGMGPFFFLKFQSFSLSARWWTAMALRTHVHHSLAMPQSITRKSTILTILCRQPSGKHTDKNQQEHTQQTSEENKTKQEQSNLPPNGHKTRQVNRNNIANQAATRVPFSSTTSPSQYRYYFKYSTLHPFSGA